ncbi:hypothetical protein BJF90_26355 [Pseudonocardia sp. CNS-004]|nr:hypothetical protein BJF90_26355 [Pseudonocardia sp. CNS-004]
MAYATADDISARLGRELDESEVIIVSIRLDDAERIIRSRIPDLDGKVLDAELDHDLLVMIEAEAVLRLLKNPDGYSGETDGNYSYQINSRVASGKLEIMDDEWALLGVAQGMFVIAPTVRTVSSGLYFPAAWYEEPIHPAVWWGNEESS